jgi:hypothetical protein
MSGANVIVGSQAAIGVVLVAAVVGYRFALLVALAATATTIVRLRYTSLAAAAMVIAVASVCVSLDQGDASPARPSRCSIPAVHSWPRSGWRRCAQPARPRGLAQHAAPSGLAHARSNAVSTPMNDPH